MSLWREWKPNVAGILGIPFTAENTNLAKNRKFTTPPKKIATPFTSKVPDFIRLLTHILFLPPWFLNEQKLKITCKLPLPQDLMASPLVQSLAQLSKQLGPRQPSACQGHKRDGSASRGDLGAALVYVAWRRGLISTCLLNLSDTGIEQSHHGKLLLQLLGEKLQVGHISNLYPCQVIPISTSTETKIPSSRSLSCHSSPQHQDEVIIMQDEGFHLTDPRGSLTRAEAAV